MKWQEIMSFFIKYHWSCSMNTSPCKMTTKVLFCTTKFLLPTLLQWVKLGDYYLLTCAGDRPQITQNMVYYLPSTPSVEVTTTLKWQNHWQNWLDPNQTTAKFELLQPEKLPGYLKTEQITCRKHWDKIIKQAQELAQQLSFRTEVHFKWNCAIVPPVQWMHNNKLLNPLYFSKSFSMAHLKAAVLAHTILLPQMHRKENEI